MSWLPGGDRGARGSKGRRGEAGGVVHESTDSGVKGGGRVESSVVTCVLAGLSGTAMEGLINGEYQRAERDSGAGV